MQNRQDLRSTLQRLDGAGYGALKQLRGTYDLGAFRLSVLKVQSDPYAPPSRVAVEVDLDRTQIPRELLSTPEQRVAVADFLARDLSARVRRGPRETEMLAPGQEILPRTSLQVGPDSAEARLSVHLPAAGRRVKGRAAARILTEQLPETVQASALNQGLDVPALRAHVASYLDQLRLRELLVEQDLVAFLADGSVLARAAGNSDLPLEGADPFRAPESLERTWDLPSGRRVRGMAVPRGVTVVVGGGYHGKSTLLRALERGICPHVPGDGRELVACVPDAVSVRAEDGRSVAGTDISWFIRDLPSGTDTTRFSTTNASGSTSQAASLCEALDAGASALLVDEDTSATNFMLRDAAMRALVPDDAEPITPLSERVRALWEQHGVSTVLVAGGTGAFFGTADHVVAMSRYQPFEVTERAREIVEDSMPPGPTVQHPMPQTTDGSGTRGAGSESGARPGRPRPAPRVPAPSSWTEIIEGRPPRARGRGGIQVGKSSLDLSLVGQLLDPGQTQAVAGLLREAALRCQGRTDLVDLVEEVMEQVETEGLDGVLGGRPGDLVMPRRFEVLAAANRWRKLRVL